MISRYEKKIIDKLLDKYEASKSFIGTNKVKQRFSVRVGSLFPKYMDHSNYQVFQAVNEAIETLTSQSFVLAKANSAHVYDRVDLNVNKLEEIYHYIGRRSKKDIHQAVLHLLEAYKGKNEILNQYYQAQYKRIYLNQSIQFFNEDLKELERILIAVDELLKVEVETFMRDFSVRVFSDSKAFEAIAGKVMNLLFEFGNFPDKDQVLGNLNIIKNPTYVNFKGAGSITIKGQTLDLTKLKSDIAISSIMLGDIEQIKVTGKAVITIENLTSFHTFSNRDMFVIYLGGYHNTVRREFIKKIYEQNPKVTFYHFGDIDAGGFYILEHLKTQTGVDFKPFKMNIETLKNHSSYTKRLTENDKIRLQRLSGGPYGAVIQHMLENNCKLEQEAIKI